MTGVLHKPGFTTDLSSNPTIEPSGQAKTEATRQAVQERLRKDRAAREETGCAGVCHPGLYPLLSKPGVSQGVSKGDSGADKAL